MSTSWIRPPATTSSSCRCHTCCIVHSWSSASGCVWPRLPTMYLYNLNTSTALAADDVNHAVCALGFRASSTKTPSSSCRSSSSTTPGRRCRRSKTPTHSRTPRTKTQACWLRTRSSSRSRSTTSSSTTTPATSTTPVSGRLPHSLRLHRLTRHPATPAAEVASQWMACCAAACATASTAAVNDEH